MPVDLEMVKKSLADWRNWQTAEHAYVVEQFNALSVDDRLEFLFRLSVVHAFTEHGAQSPFRGGQPVTVN